MASGAISRRQALKLVGLSALGFGVFALFPSVAEAHRKHRRRHHRPKSPSPPPPTYLSNAIILGAFTAGVPWGFENVDQLSELVGQPQQIIHWFQDWTMPFNGEYMREAASRNASVLLSWEPWDWNSPTTEQPQYTLRSILDGNHDTYIRQWSQAAASWGKPFYLRFAPEMNGNWRPWNPGVNGNTSAEFLSAWKKIYTIFQQEGASNVEWVWCPMADFEGATPFSSLYPGDDYVQWVGLDGFNWGTTKPWTEWQSFSDIFASSYDHLVNLTKKPMMIAELASTEVGGDKASWIREAYLREIPINFPLIRAVAWFNANKETDWRVNSSAASLKAYREVVAYNLYQ